MLTILAYEVTKRVVEAVAIAVLTTAGTKLITYGVDKGLQKLETEIDKKKPKEEKKEPNGNV